MCTDTPISSHEGLCSPCAFVVSTMHACVAYTHAGRRTKHCLVSFAAGNFPVGLSSSGTPTSLQVVGPPGYDEIILSLLLAMEKLFGDFPAPPNPSLCAGCLSNVTVREVSWCPVGACYGKASLSEVSCRRWGFGPATPQSPVVTW